MLRAPPFKSAQRNLVVLWLFGFIGGIGGELINLLLIVAVIVVLYRFFTGRNVVTGKAT